MRIEEIEEYEQLVSTIRAKKEALESNQLSLRLAKEDLQGLNVIVKNHETTLNDRAHELKSATISVQISDVVRQLQENRSAQRELIEPTNPPLEGESESEREFKLNNLQKNATILENKKLVFEQELVQIGRDSSILQDTLNSAYAQVNDKERFIGELSQTINQQYQELEQLFDIYKPMSDPRTLVEALDDSTPFLLFPVRLETRFMTLKHVRKVADIGEIRDEVDTSTSVNRTSTSARASLRELQPVPKIIPESTKVIEDVHELWVRVIPDDIAIHTHETRLTSDEFDTGKSFWTSVLDDLADDELRLAAWRVVVNSFGSERAAWIIKQTEPNNITDNPIPQDAIFPSLTLKSGTWTDQPRSKIMPDRFVVRVYTNDTNYREVIGNLVPNPLPLGINPNSPDLDTSFGQVDHKVDFPDELKWMTNFEKAEAIGMGIRIPLLGNERTEGFDRILVLGLKLSENKTNSKQLLEELFNNHHYTNGFSLLPQGTPTNNTEDVSSGYNGREIGHEESFGTELMDPLFTQEIDRFNKTDGQWFSELLGISSSTLEHVRFADNFDQREGMAMNAALWPATMGYYMKQMLTPLVLNKTQYDISKFYCNNVIARGRIPSFRIDNQPYGILITTAFSKWKFSEQYGNQNPAVKNMFEKVLIPIDNEFSRLVENVIHSESLGDVQDNFLKMLGLHASSVEYHQRFASGQYFSWNLLKYFENSPNQPAPSTTFPSMDDSIPNTKKAIYNSSIGFDINVVPRILELLFIKDQRLLDGPLIDLDVLPLSEKRGIQPFPDTETNYIEWILSSNFNEIRAEDFSNITDVIVGQKPPKALLYLLLRHGFLLQYINTAIQILLDQNIVQQEAELEFELQKGIDDVAISIEESQLLSSLVTSEVTYAFEQNIAAQVQRQLEEGRIDRTDIERAKDLLREENQHVVQAEIQSQITARVQRYGVEVSKWDYLTQIHPEVTQDKTLLQFILDDLAIGGPHTECLQKIKHSLEVLKDMPTARLERCMAESLDTCNYRLDAWFLGMVNERLESQVENNITNGSTGSFIGSFGILEHLKPNESFPGIHVVEIDNSNGAVSSDFVYVGTDSETILEYDDELGKVVSPPRINEENLGFIHGPSVNHAVAAAILRAGYAGHQGTASPDSALAVNLRSDRVRKALFYLEGVKNGQDLASLLGYQFERTLHDLNAGLDQYILDIRRQFPLVANGLVDDDPAEGSIESFEARNVVNGLQLIEAYRDNPTGWDSGVSPTIPNTERTLIMSSIDKIVDHMDAIGDLMMSEGMFQVATGNHERAGAVIKALGEGNVIPDPQIIKTPRLDKVYMQRKALLFDTSSGESQAWPGDESPRSYSEPALNKWLMSVLPNPNSVLINYQYTTLDIEGAEVINEGQLMLSQLGLQPIDFMYMLADQGDTENGTQLSNLVNYVIVHSVINVETPVSIKFIDRAGFTSSDEITIFELLPLIRSIQDMIGQGRVAKPEDFLIEGQVYSVKEAALPSQGIDLTNIETRLTEALGPATTVGRKGLIDVKGLIEDAMNHADSIVDITGNEYLLDNLRDALVLASKFAVQGSIPLSAYEYSIEARNQLSGQAVRILGQLSLIEAKASNGFTELSVLTETSDRLAKFQEIAEYLFGRGFKVFPEFIFYNQTDLDLSRTNNPNLLLSAEEFAVDEWLHGASKVRSKMANYHMYSMIGESLIGNTPNREVVQLPIISTIDDRWLSASLPVGYKIPDEAISIVLDLPELYSTSVLQSGLVLDEWTESIPESNAITGVAINYDQPNSEAPNTLLLAVTPEETGSWKWNDLMDTLDETLSMAKKRAVDPDILNAHSPLGHALPALIAAIEAGDTAPGLDFGRNIVNADSGQAGPINLVAYTEEASQ